MRYLFIHAVIFACLFAAATAPAAAALVTFDGEVDFFGPTFDRPPVSGFDLGPSNRDVAYDARLFHVSDAGSYTIVTETVGDLGFWNGTLLIYANAFDPSDSAANLVGYTGVDDDILAPSTLTLPLDVDRQYVLVQAGVTSFDFGPYSGTAEGGGTFAFGSIVPEPSGLAVLPLVVLLLSRRHGRSRSA